MLSSCSTIEYLRTILGEHRAALAFIYFDYRDKDKQNLGIVIGELTKQLLLQVPSVPDEVWRFYQKHTAVTAPTAKQIFSLLLPRFASVYVCIDALDECQPQFRGDLFQFLATSEHVNLRIFCTGRYSVAAETIKILRPLGLKTIDIRADRADIRLYIEQMISRDRHKGAMDDQLREQLTKELVSHDL